MNIIGLNHLNLCGRFHRAAVKAAQDLPFPGFEFCFVDIWEDCIDEGSTGRKVTTIRIYLF
jgi:hypothetical protein